MTAQERLIAAAKAELGYVGKKSNAQLDDPTANTPGLYNKFARDLDALGDFYNGRKNGYDWCDVFVDWCFITVFGREVGQKLLCQPDRSCGAGTKYSMDYYKAKKRWFTSPQPGDQIFFGTAAVTSHTGIVTGVGGGYLTTVEGNCGSPSAVRQCKYPVGYASIKGYGRPDWSIVPVGPVPEDKPVQNVKPAAPAEDEKEDETMTYEQWKQYMEQYRKELGEKPQSRWAEKELGCAITEGITDGQRPRDLVTREEAAVMVYRAKGS